MGDLQRSQVGAYGAYHWMSLITTCGHEINFPTETLHNVHKNLTYTIWFLYDCFYQYYFSCRYSVLMTHHVLLNTMNWKTLIPHSPMFLECVFPVMSSA